MDIDELRKKSHSKVLLYGPSMRGKTMAASRVALLVAEAGGKVKYVDTESEGSTTLIKLVDESRYSEEAVENIEYVVVGDYQELEDEIGEENGNHDRYDLIIVDPLDHKHTFAIKAVTDAKMKSEADWNQYPAIYSAEKQLMEIISKPSTNFLCTLDPDSGSMDKPKGAQTNIKGFFSVVGLLKKGEETYSTRIKNWVGRPDLIDAEVETNMVCEKIAQEVLPERLK